MDRRDAALHRLAGKAESVPRRSGARQEQPARRDAAAMGRNVCDFDGGRIDIEALEELLERVSGDLSSRSEPWRGLNGRAMAFFSYRPSR